MPQAKKAAKETGATATMMLFPALALAVLGNAAVAASSEPQLRHGEGSACPGADAAGRAAPDVLVTATDGAWHFACFFPGGARTGDGSDGDAAPAEGSASQVID